MKFTTTYADEQGETEIALYAGVRQTTDGSDWIVTCARRDDPRPLYLLVWGGIEDLAEFVPFRSAVSGPEITVETFTDRSTNQDQAE